MYSSGGSTTLEGTEDPEPSGGSKLCLSCHDGTVGLDDFGGGPNTFGFMDPASLVFVGTDLRSQHPISITYEPTLDLGLNPVDTPVTIGGYTVGTTTFPTRDGDIATLLVPDGKVQCSSCHDVHNTFVATTNLLRLPMTDSTLCLTCHNK
ncbi:MAG: cytochrome c3 family protein [Candidatus Thiodiazotropha sp.]